MLWIVIAAFIWAALSCAVTLWLCPRLFKYLPTADDTGDSR